MVRKKNSNRHGKSMKSFAAAACLASAAFLGGPGTAPSSAAAATAPLAPDFALHPHDAVADPAGARVFAASPECSDQFNLFPASTAPFYYATPDTAPAAGPAPAPPKTPGFYKGTWDLEIIGSHMAPVYRTRDHFNAGSVGVGYFLADGFSANVALVGYSIDQPHNYALGAGFDLYARVFLLTLDRFSIYADGGAGAIFTDKAVPEFGTAFNFTPRAGVGLSLRITDNAYLIGGARYWHLSNAGYHSRERNPGFDSAQYYGGVIFTF